MAGSSLQSGSGIAAVVKVPERGCVQIAAETWQELSHSRDFWAAVERNVLSVENHGLDKVRLCGSCFVGRIICGNIAIELEEKIPGALANLIRFAGPEGFRIAPLPSTASNLGDLSRIILAAMLEEVNSYVTKGRESRYVSVPEERSLVAGRLNITASVKLRARGLRHILAFERPFLSFSTEVNSVVAAALREAVWLAQAASLQDLVAKARGLSLLFDDCQSLVRLRRRRENMAQLADRLADDSRHKRFRKLLLLCALVLSHETFGDADLLRRRSPRTWFVNLEQLFEAAIRNVLKTAVQRRFQVSRPSPPLPIFNYARGDFRANPDLVIAAARGIEGIGDVKYKQFTGTASASDIYQLLVHAATYRSGVCFLIYPGDAFAAVQLGVSSTGSETWLFQVNLNSLSSSVSAAASLAWPEGNVDG